MTSSDDVAYSGALSMLPIGVADSRELLQVGIPGDKGFQTAHQVVDSSSDTAARRDADAPEHFSVALGKCLHLVCSSIFLDYYTCPLLPAFPPSSML